MFRSLMSSDLSQLAVYFETANKRTSSDIFGTLGEKPDDTTQHAQVAQCVLTTRQFLFQVSVTPVPSWLGCRHLTLAV